MNYKNCEIIIFFSGGIDSLYQIKQWQQPLEKLNSKHKVLYIITDYEVYLHSLTTQTLEVVYLAEFTDLIEFYNINEFAIILYLNNSLRNFQSIRYSKGYHIHITHGESEKESMRSNQSQAYDYVFTVGQRGIDRYEQYLLNFDVNKFIPIGRPQLDFVGQVNITKKPNQKVILYAPTWEATHSSMDYTSVAIFGEELVEKILANENNILIYKPHSAIGTRDEVVKQAHENIKKITLQAHNAYYMEQENIIDIFALVDFAFFDNTSVMIDYLSVDKPAAYFQIIQDQSVYELAKAFKTINHNNFSKVVAILAEQLSDDTNKIQRNKIKNHYLGRYTQGESTKVFIQTVSKLIIQRNKKIKNINK